MHPDMEEVLFSQAAIENKVAELGAILSRDYQNLNPLCICILKGAILFTADLIRKMDIPLQLDVIAVSSYGASTSSSGVVRILKDLETSVENRHVLIIEDIIDTGLTLSYLKDILERRDPASLKIVSFLDKPSRRKVEIEPDYLGYSIPDHFVVGYGFDYAEKYRNVPYIGALKKTVYS